MPAEKFAEAYQVFLVQVQRDLGEAGAAPVGT